MKVVVAIDSLKGSLTSLEAGEAIREGILRAIPDAEVVVRPLADGGEGTVEALTYGMGGVMERVTVTGPLGRPVECAYGRVPPERLAIVEMSGAAGITLVPEAERNPMNTTTCGVGEVIRDAIAKGCRTFIVGIGGSATNDGGIGMLQALGFGLLNESGEQVPFGAKGLEELRRITTEHVLPELKECTFRIACDVTNPLCGENGASAVYGPQKGATPEMVRQMDRWLGDFAALAKEAFPAADAETPGTGAAGGMGFAFLTFLGGRLNSGARIVLDETHLEDYVQDADIVITGEGRLDEQTVMGKAPSGVAKIAKRHGKTVIAFSGSVTEDAAACNAKGIDAFFPILRQVVTLQDAMDHETARHNMVCTAEQVFRLIHACRK
jgi:glycerate kinase